MFKKSIWYLSHITPHFRGKEFILRALSRPKNNYKKYLIKRNGVNFNISGQDLNEFNLSIRQYHSKKLHILINQIISFFKFKVFFDIGANIGGLSLPIINENNNLHGYLFEPSPDVLSRLLANISLNNKIVNRIKIYDFVISNRTTLDKFYVSNEATNSGVGGAFKYINRKNETKLYKHFKSIDDLVGENKLLPVPQIIKIDVEGYEFEVLIGMQNILKNNNLVVIFEHSPTHLTYRKFKIYKVNNFLNSIGYNIYNVNDLSLVKSKDLLKNNDFLAMKKNNYDQYMISKNKN